MSKTRPKPRPVSLGPVSARPRLSAAQIQKEQAEMERRKVKEILRVAIENPSRRGYEGQMSGAAGEACIIYDQALALAVALKQAGGGLESRLLYDAYSAQCRMWDAWRRAAGLDAGHDARYADDIGGDGVPADRDAGPIFRAIMEAETAIKTAHPSVGRRAALLVRACTESPAARAEMHSLSGGDAVTLIFGLRALARHFKMV